MSRFSLAGLRARRSVDVVSSGHWATAQALLAGLLHCAAFAPTEAWPLQILALAWLAGLSWSVAPRRAAWLGACFAFAWLGSGLWWLYISMHDHGHLPALLSIAAVALLAAGLALFHAVPLALAAWLRDRGRPAEAGAGAIGAWHGGVWALCWLLGELARASLLSGFPWIASGYAHTVGPLAVFAPWVGVYGICLIAALLAAGLVGLVGRAWKPLTLGVAIVLAGQLLPQDFTAPSGQLRASLVQPNVPQEQKFDRERWGTNLADLAVQVDSARGQLVLTPESVVPVPLAYLDEAVLQRFEASARGRSLLLGTFLGNEQDGFVNSLSAFGQGAPYAYGKRHLLPFGEITPLGFHWLVRLLEIPMDDQARGQHQRALEVAGQRVRPLICYEDLFGEDFVASVQGDANGQETPEMATVLANASNLGWFGRWMVQDQHLQFSIMRTLEFQRPLIRATNTGATAAIDHRGRVLARLPADTAGVLEVEVEGRRGATPYARWLGRFGLWPFGLLLAVLLGLAALRARR
ncbi:apolipoprotein N-acyltransferase [Paucibacter sp. APW11]|uniref:Apolipoprotein N-acyltransferase n=1 Tax=Roseateles aquae TaxID=3077235 RepID=A0ABU3PDY9_9BURK|nr:apolipoprotein N-acyltransferase [Paucibacter sp. APW11]MDT9000805.1 apolipoprotein N-acyltransferase [Paucibacter sp. APW11]